MENRSQTMQSGNAEGTWTREIATFAVRLTFFALTLVPLGALLLPWITLDGTGETHTGIATVALLASPVSAYLYEVNPLQAAALTIGPALIALLAMLTAYNYHRRKSIYWAPLAMLALACAVAYGTGELANKTHAGLSIFMATAIMLILHQTLIRLQVAMRRKGKLPKVYRALAIAGGIGYYRWRDI